VDEALGAAAEFEARRDVPFPSPALTRSGDPFGSTMADRIVDEGLLARRRPAAAAKGKLPHTHGAGAGSEGEPRANSATPGVAALPAPVDAGELSDETESDAEEGGWVSREPAASTRGPSQVRRSAAGSGGRAGASDRGSSQRRQDRPPSNREIRVPQVRVVDATGANLGIMSPSKGIEIAKGQGLDLVMVSAAATPPVCKIAPLHKVVAALKAAESERRRAESSRKTKEMRFTARISGAWLQEGGLPACSPACGVMGGCSLTCVTAAVMPALHARCRAPPHFPVPALSRSRSLPLQSTTWM
jgi:hypothetical protein